MSWLSWLLTSLLSFVTTRLAAFLVALADQIKRRQQIEKRAEDDSKPAKEIKPDDTAEKVDQAIDDELKHL